MTRLKRLVVEVHRRSLWQVLLVYVGASWAVMEVADHVMGRFLLPEWVYGGSVMVLLIGFPIVLASALVRETSAEEMRERAPELDAPQDRRSTPKRAPISEGGLIAFLRKHLTWPRAVLAVVLALAAIGLASVVIVVQGVARVAEARGSAGDAIAEQDTIIVAEFEVSEDEADIALAARQALLIDLAQSQYISVYGSSAIGRVLRRMALPDTTTLTKQIALEVAEREGLAAVLAVTISRLGNDYVFSARVIQPDTEDELIAVRTTARSERLLEGLERLSREVRRRLGEEQSAIRQSKPLPRVTTRSLEALRKYAQSGAAWKQSLYGRTLDLVEEAIRLDSTFALAYREASVNHYMLGRMDKAIALAQRGYELRDRLPDRERLDLEAWYYYVVEDDPRRSAETYDLLGARYPRDFRAHNNAGVMYSAWLGDTVRAFAAYQRGAVLQPGNPTALNNLLVSAWARGRLDLVDSIISVMPERGLEDQAARHSRERAFRLGDWARAEFLCDSLLALPSNPERLAGDRLRCGSYDIARGRIRRGIERLEAAAEHAAAIQSYGNYVARVARLALAEQIRGRPEAARSRIGGVLTRFPADSIPPADRVNVQTRLRALSAELGLLDLAERIARSYPPRDTTRWYDAYREGFANAAVALGNGEAERAVSLLRGIESCGYKPTGLRNWLKIIYGMSFDALGEPDSAVAYFQQVVGDPPYRPTFPVPSHFPLVLRRLAELEEVQGNTEAAIRHYQRFVELWEDADPELQPQVEAARRAIEALSPDT